MWKTLQNLMREFGYKQHMKMNPSAKRGDKNIQDELLQDSHDESLEPHEPVIKQSRKTLQYHTGGYSPPTRDHWQSLGLDEGDLDHVTVERTIDALSKGPGSMTMPSIASRITEKWTQERNVFPTSSSDVNVQSADDVGNDVKVPGDYAKVSDQRNVTLLEQTRVWPPLAVEESPVARSTSQNFLTQYPVNRVKDVNSEPAMRDLLQGATEAVPLIRNRDSAMRNKPHTEKVLLADLSKKWYADVINIGPDTQLDACVIARSLADALTEHCKKQRRDPFYDNYGGFGRGLAKTVYGVRLFVLVRGLWFKIEFDVLEDIDMPSRKAALLSSKASMVTGTIGPGRSHGEAL